MMSVVGADIAICICLCSRSTTVVSDIPITSSGSMTLNATTAPSRRERILLTRSVQTVATIQLTQGKADKYRECPIVLDFGTDFYVFPPNIDNIVKFAIHNNGFLYKPTPNAPSTPRTPLYSDEDGLRIPKEVLRRLCALLRRVCLQLAEQLFSGTRLCRYNDSPDDD
ncbi:hypothetical protein NM688_g9451 [Phlebia brevispora]|uniref:Uncharacterized protein n=1 Tax=Phlebia brevispora TaxID=194682 RepID=A0ACC1RJU5_9APHY|nr:hypothetical protein NM688_g9451 [Phlebia brevispora]